MSPDPSNQTDQQTDSRAVGVPRNIGVYRISPVPPPLSSPVTATTHRQQPPAVQRDAMQLSHEPWPRASAKYLCSAFNAAQHKVQGFSLGNETRLTRRRPRSCHAVGDGHDRVAHGGSVVGNQGEAAASTPASMQGQNAETGNQQHKQPLPHVVVDRGSATLRQTCLATAVPHMCSRTAFASTSLSPSNTVLKPRRLRVRKMSKKWATRSARNESFISGAKKLGSGGQWREVLRQLDQLTEDGIPLNSYIYNSAMSSIAKSGRWREALGLRDRMLAEGIRPDGYSFNALIEACSKGGQVGKGLELLREMVNEGVSRDVFSYNAALHGYVPSGDSESALRMLEDMVADGVRPDLVTYGTVLACCGKRGEWQRCMSLMERMRSEGLAPNVYCFSSLMNACGKAGRWALAVESLEAMEASGLTPNEHNWLTAISACGNAGRWEEALRLINKLEALAQEGRGVPMSTTLFSFGIDACAKAGRWDQGVLLLERMKNNPATPPDARTYSSLIQACAEDANLQDALAYLTEMRNVGLAPTIFAYISAMRAAKMAGQWREALSLLNEIADVGLITDVFSFNNVVDAFGKDGQLARLLVQPQTADEETVAVPGGETRTHDLTSWQAEGPEELLKRMKQNGVKPSIASFNVLIDACARGGKHWAASKLLQKMKSCGLRPNKVSYDSVIHACRVGNGDEWKLALELLDDMRKSGLTPDAFSFNTAIASCVKAGDWRRSLDLLAGMQVEGITPDIFSYNGVISACAKGGQWRIGLELLAKVRADPLLEPNQRTYTAAINCFKQFQAGQPIASLASTLAGYDSREGEPPGPLPTSNVYLGATLDGTEGREVGEE